MLALSLQSCGGGGGGGGGDNGIPVGEGLDSPVPLAVSTPRRSQVDTGISLYSVSVTSGARYTISLTGMTDDVELFVFDNSGYTDIACYSMNDGTADEQCTATATASGAFYLEILGIYTTAGAFYTITVAPAPPTAPIGVAAVAGNTQVTVSWPLVTDAASYNIYYSETNGAGTGGTKITGVTSPYVHTGRTNGITYYYVVTAVNAHGESTASSQVSATPNALPPAVPAGVVAVPGNAQVTLSWSTAAYATSYNLYYSETNGAGTGGTLITGVTSPYVHTGRTNGTTYYYVVTAVNDVSESTASSQVSARPGVPLLTANFDDGTLQGWSATGTWAVTNASSYSGSYSVTDSPSGSYSNSTNTWLTSPVFDLTGTTAPSLSFYHRYEVENGWDDCYVEVSMDGGSTFGQLASYTNTSSSFMPVVIDLSPYMASSTVVLRFRLQTDSSVVRDGWYIDDIVVTQ